jgi:hypothetical protein
MDEFDLDCMVSDLLSTDDTLDEIIMEVINSDEFRDAVIIAVLSGDGQRLAKLFVDAAERLAIEIEEMRIH